MDTESSALRASSDFPADTSEAADARSSEARIIRAESGPSRHSALSLDSSDAESFRSAPKTTSRRFSPNAMAKADGPARRSCGMRAASALALGRLLLGGVDGDPGGVYEQLAYAVLPHRRLGQVHVIGGPCHLALLLVVGVREEQVCLGDYDHVRPHA